MSLSVSSIFITPKVAPFDHIKPMTLVKANMRRDFRPKSEEKITGICFLLVISRNMGRTMSRSKRVTMYVLPVVVISFLLNVPKFLEVQAGLLKETEDDITVIQVIWKT